MSYTPKNQRSLFRHHPRCARCGRPLDPSHGPGTGSRAPWAWSSTPCYGRIHAECLARVRAEDRCPEDE